MIQFNSIDDFYLDMSCCFCCIVVLIFYHVSTLGVRKIAGNCLPCQNTLGCCIFCYETG